MSFIAGSNLARLFSYQEIADHHLRGSTSFQKISDFQMIAGQTLINLLFDGRNTKIIGRNCKAYTTANQGPADKLQLAHC